jgi:hypothetical protein
MDRLESYFVVISKEPMVSPPTSYTGWTWEEDPEVHSWSTIDDRANTTYTFTALEPNTTYYLRVDVVGDEQRSFSNVHSVRTLTDAPDMPDVDPGEGEVPIAPGPWSLWVVLALVAMALLVAVLLLRGRTESGK